MAKFKIISSLILFYVIINEVKSECGGVVDCLKAFLAGDISDDVSESVIKVFEIENKSVDTNVKFFGEENFYNGGFDIFNATNSFIDAIKNIFDFGNKENTVKVNYTFSNTNWTVTYKSDIISNFSETNNARIATTQSNFISNFQNVHNVTVNKYLKKDHQKGLTKLVQDNDVSNNFGDESYGELENNTTELDYPIIDYISMYEDTTNELIEYPTTENTKTNIASLNIVLSPHTNSINEIDYTTELIEYEKQGFFFESPPEKLTDALDIYIKKEDEDLFEDYPEIPFMELYQERQRTKIPETTTFTDENEVTTEDPFASGFAYLGIPVEGQMLCTTRRAFFVSRQVGLPFDVENYWDGNFQSETFRNLKKAELVLELTNIANITAIGDNTVVTRINDTTYAIKGLNPKQSIDFKVQAPPGVDFPFVKKLTLNGREICKRRRQWSPSLLGSGKQAVVSPLISPNEEGIYYCGRSKINFAPLVVKGLPTKEGDYPWHVALFTKNSDTKNWDYSCGGTILHRKTIITAAHCMFGKDGHVIDKKRLLVIAGKYRLFEVDSNQKPLKIKEIIVHQNYTNTHTNITNDLALLILEDHLEYGQYIQPICQWNSKQEEKEIVYQEYGTVVGWGATENDTLSESLLAASLRVIPDNLCLKSRPSFFKRYITGNTFCAGNKNGTSACNGDSGGGLIFPIKELDGKTSWYLRGVVSVGVRRAGGLCDPEHYVVFTDVVRYREWIETHQEL